MMNFTPGPWTANICTAPHRTTAYSITAGINAQIPICHSTRWDQYGLADARLIAATPELYEIVRLLAERDGRDDPLVQDAARLIERLEKAVQA